MDVYCGNGFTIYCRKNTLTDRNLADSTMRGFFENEKSLSMALKDTKSEDFLERVVAVRDFYHRISTSGVLRIIAESPTAHLFDMSSIRSEFLSASVDLMEAPTAPDELAVILRAMRVSAEDFRLSKLFAALAETCPDHTDLIVIMDYLS